MPGIIGGVGTPAAHSLTAEHTQGPSSPSQAKQLLGVDVRVGSADNAPAMPKITTTHSSSIGERLAHAFSEFKQSFVGGIRDLITKITSCFRSEPISQTETKPNQQAMVNDLFRNMIATNLSTTDVEDQTTKFFNEFVKEPESDQLLNLDTDEIRKSVAHLEYAEGKDYQFYEFANRLADLVESAKSTDVNHTKFVAVPEIGELV